MLKKTLLLLLCLATPYIHAALVLNYNNDTGAISIVGSDSGIGSDFAGLYRAYAWNSGSIAEAGNVADLFVRLNSAPLTLNGTPSTLAGGLATGTPVGGMTAFTNTAGPLNIPFYSDTTITGIWGFGYGSFVYSPNAGYNTNESLTVNITGAAIPEPSTYIAGAGFLALGAFLVIRRRKVRTDTAATA